MRNIPTATKNLLVLNILAFIAGIMFSRMGIDLNNVLGLHFFLADDFHLWQLITYMFMHGSFMHILMNMFMLWMFGMVMENVWGSKKFLFYYIVTGVGAGLCQELAQYATYMAEGLSRYQYVATEMGRIPMDAYLNRWCFGSSVWCAISIRTYIPQRAYVYYSNSYSIKGKMDYYGVYCDGTSLCNGHKQRRSSTSGTSRRNAVRLSTYKVLVQAPLL